ncbi:MAG: hypothetical protein RLZZ519_243, partial [Bacteroidota bacterium]
PNRNFASFIRRRASAGRVMAAQKCWNSWGGKWHRECAAGHDRRNLLRSCPLDLNASKRTPPIFPEFSVACFLYLGFGVRKILRPLLLLAVLMFGTGRMSAQVGTNMTLLSNWDNNNLPNHYNITYNAVVGWHDGNGHEYAIIGSHAWTHIIDVTNPATPIVRDSVAGTFNQCIHREFQTYSHYLYGVADEGNSTLQIIDLSYLPDSVHMIYNSSQFFQRAHTIFVDSAAGRLYAAGTNTQNGGIIVLDIGTNPEVPTLLGSVNNQSYTHDMHVRNDTAYMNNGWDGRRIMDYTNPAAPVMLATMPSYPQQGYNHSSWLDEAGDYLVMCDETRNKSCKIVDVRNLGNVNVAAMFRSALLTPDTTSIAHNPFVVGNYAVVSYYHDGVQIWDISNRTAPVHVAGYDTQPNNTNYNDWYGAWGVYPFLPSGTLLASDIHNGLFVLRVPFPFPNALTATNTAVPAICSYSSNGQATVTPNGGTSPYTYQWSSGQTTAMATGLLPGTYTVTISDRYGYDIVDTVTVTSPSPLQLNVQIGAESCDGTADGAIDLHTSGGTPGYNFIWSTGDMVEDLNSLTAGTYSVTVTDAAGCVYSDTVSLSFLNPSPIAVAGQDTVICTNSLLVNANVPTQGTGHWDWISGNGTIQNPNIPSTAVVNLQQGQNLLAWIVFDGQCSGVDTLEIFVSSTALINAGNDTVVCSSNLQLAGSSSSNAQGMWTAVPNTVAFSNPSIPNAVAGGLQPGQYQFFWSVSDAHCQAIDSMTAFVSRLPFAAYTFNANQLSVNFQNLSQYATSWHWDFGDGNTSLLQNPSHAYAQAGVYTVCLIATDTCGSDTSCQTLGLANTGISSLQSPLIQVWPNPFSNWMDLAVAGTNSDVVECKLLDLQGRTLWQSNAQPQNGTVQLRIELPDLPAGMYFLDVRPGEWGTTSWSKVLPVIHQH